MRSSTSGCGIHYDAVRLDQTCSDCQPHARHVSHSRSLVVCHSASGACPECHENDHQRSSRRESTTPSTAGQRHCRRPFGQLAPGSQYPRHCISCRSLQSLPGKSWTMHSSVRCMTASARTGMAQHSMGTRLRKQWHPPARLSSPLEVCSQLMPAEQAWAHRDYAHAQHSTFFQSAYTVTSLTRHASYSM